MATNVMRCPVNCVPDPYLFSKIYGVVKRGEEEKYMELFQTAPQKASELGSGGDKGNKGMIMIVVLLFVCFVITVAVLGGVYYFQDELKVQLGYTDDSKPAATT